MRGQECGTIAAAQGRFRPSAPAACSAPSLERTLYRIVTTDHQTFIAALDALVAEIREDRAVLAAILCGSLSHDRVWSRSDIDLVLVTIDDRKVESDSVSLYADGVNVHAMLVPRAEFRRMVEGALRQSFMHSFLAKGRLLYTHDDTLATLFGTLHEMGDRDRDIALFRAATNALPTLYKAHKFMRTRGDVNYTALWLLYTATPLAQIEVISAGQLVDREVIPQALALNPALLNTVYTDLLNTKKTAKSVRTALDEVDAYMAARARSLFAPVLDHLRETGEARSCTEIDDYFRKKYGIEHVTTACEYLADIGLIGKVSTAARLTKRSHVDVQELAFVSLD
jgi:predicted nucleotidyltransferase